MIYLKLYNWETRDLESMQLLSQALANYFPEPQHSVSGIYELLINAVEHGNLGIGYAVKTELIRRGIWKEEVRRRMSLPENFKKEIEVRLNYNENECRLTISDQGNGFPWREFVGQPTDLRRPNGRGLHIALNSKFDRVIFNPVGNEVTCVASYDQWAAIKREENMEDQWYI